MSKVKASWQLHCLRCLHTAQHSMQHVVQHVASNVASNVVQQVAAFNTYRAVCKFVACNSQQFRTNPIGSYREIAIAIEREAGDSLT